MMEINLEDIPDALYIELSEICHNALWNKLLKNNTISEIAKYQKISIRNLYKWKEGNSGYPLVELKKLLKIADIRIKEISIKTQRDSKQIKNLKLPIKIDEKFVLFVGHLFGDGGIDKQFQLHYTTNDIDNINEFKRIIKDIFGDIEYNEIDYGSRITLVYPKTLGILVNSIIDTPVGSKVNSNFCLSDKIVSTMTNKMKTNFIRAFYKCDGESDKISIAQGCKYLNKPPAILLQIQKLLNDMKFMSAIIKPSSTYKTSSGVHRRWVLRIIDKKEKRNFEKLFLNYTVD